jgi:hypothetical protein
LNLASDIKELILLQEGVILPGLGGFITAYQSAEIQKESHLIRPPSVKVSFDNKMITDNGLLVFHIAKKNNISEEEARRKVNEFIDELKKEIHANGSFTIEDVGTISKSPEGELKFRAAADKNYRLQSFGLPVIEVPHPLKAAEIKPLIVPAPAVGIPARKKKKIPVAALIASVILITAGAVYFSGIYDRYLKPLFPANEPNMADNVVNSDKIVFGRQVPAEEDTLAMEVNKQLMEKTSKEKALYYQETQKTTPAQAAIQDHEPEIPVAIPMVEESQVVQTGAYHIVAGSFLKPGNADRQKAALEEKGYSPRIIRKNDDFFYVTLKSFDSREEAMAEMSRIARNLDLPLWVMKK